MRNLRDLDCYRRTDLEARLQPDFPARHANGVFVLGPLHIIASAGGGWDHISVSTKSRCPTWEEMEEVRGRFTAPDEIWIQYGMPPSRHINFHPYTLHWWRPHQLDIPTPPVIMV